MLLWKGGSSNLFNFQALRPLLPSSPTTTAAFFVRGEAEAEGRVPHVGVVVVGAGVALGHADDGGVGLALALGGPVEGEVEAVLGHRRGEAALEGLVRADPAGPEVLGPAEARAAGRGAVARVGRGRARGVVRRAWAGKG